MTSILRASDAPADRDLERIATAISADAAKTPIQVVRELRSLSIPDLALRSGASAGTITKLEEGFPPDPVLLASVANALGVPGELLFQ
jgi:hypothetical protein